MKILSFWVLLGVLHWSAWAQHACLVTGQVFDYASGKAIEARVTFSQQPEENLTLLAHSGSRGYKANIFEPGKYVGIFSAEGYVSAYVEVDFLADSLLGKKEWSFSPRLLPLALDAVLPFQHLLFDVGQYALNREALPELNRLKEMLETNPAIVIRLEGHTDNQSASRRNKKLAQKRVEVIRDWLVAKGIARARIKLKALGGKDPLVKGEDQGMRKANRRVDVRIMKM